MNEGCIQDMRKVVQDAEKLKKLAQKYAKVGAARTASFGFCVADAKSSFQETTMAVRLSPIFPLVKSSPHDLGRR